MGATLIIVDFLHSIFRTHFELFFVSFSSIYFSCHLKEMLGIILVSAERLLENYNSINRKWVPMMVSRKMSAAMILLFYAFSII